MGWADTIAQAKATSRGNAPRAGDYTMEVLSIREHNGHTGFYVIGEFVVKESSNPLTPVGSRVSQSIMQGGKYPQYGLADAKCLIAACVGIDAIADQASGEREVTAPVTYAATSAAQPFTGRILKCSVTEKVDSKGITRSNFRWYPVVVNGRPAEVPPHERTAQAAPAPAHVPTNAGAHAAPPPPPSAAVWPPTGWTAHPTALGYFYKGQEVVIEADLRARAAQGKA